MVGVEDWGVALIAAGAAVAGSVVTGWFTRSTGVRQAEAARHAGEEQAAAARHAGEQQAHALLRSVQATLSDQRAMRRLDLRRQAYVAFLVVAERLVEARRSGVGISRPLMSEARHAMYVVTLQGPTEVSSAASLVVESALRSVGGRAGGLEDMQAAVRDFLFAAQDALRSPPG